MSQPRPPPYAPMGLGEQTTAGPPVAQARPVSPEKTFLVQGGSSPPEPSASPDEHGAALSYMHGAPQTAAVQGASQATPVYVGQVVHSPAETLTAQPQSVVVPVVPIAAEFVREPQQVVCQHCSHVVITIAKKDPCSLIPAIGAGFCCLVGCWPCAWLPFCWQEGMDVVHQCPNCLQTVGRARVL